MTFELKTENACIGGVDQAQTDALAGANVEVTGNAAVHRDCVSEAAVVADVVQVIEIVLDRRIFLQAPVAEHPRDVTIDGDRIRLIDNQCSIETARDLCGTVMMRVIPERTRVEAVELIREGLAGTDRLLGNVCDTVHGVRHTQPVPMHGGFFGQSILDQHLDAFALTDPKLRAWNVAPIRPDIGVGTGGANNGLTAWSGNQLELLDWRFWSGCGTKHGCCCGKTCAGEENCPSVEHRRVK